MNVPNQPRSENVDHYKPTHAIDKRLEVLNKATHPIIGVTRVRSAILDNGHTFPELNSETLYIALCQGRCFLLRGWVHFRQVDARANSTAVNT
jgi:hypothetical protein